MIFLRVIFAKKQEFENQKNLQSKINSKAP